MVKHHRRERRDCDVIAVKYKLLKTRIVYKQKKFPLRGGLRVEHFKIRAEFEIVRGAN